MKHPSKTNVPILVIFFVRPDTLRQVFESIREARPSKLFLWQDGPRSKMDMPRILECRKIFEDIDWVCEVHTNFHTENMGCDPSTFRAQKWAFSQVDRCIVLEDDMVPDQSFYPYCEELLDRYENDERINHICGVNFLGESTDCPNDYLFSYYGTGAWASWKRVADNWDSEYSFLNDEYTMKNFTRKYEKILPGARENAERRRASGYEWWEVIHGFSAYLNNRLVIVPRINLVTNIGVTAEATHGSSLKLMNKKIQRLFFMEAGSMQFPIKHPQYIIPDYTFMDEISKINCKGRPLLKTCRKIEYLFKCIIYGEFFNVVKRKITKKQK